MARSLSATMAAEIGQETGEYVFLLEMAFSGGTVYLTTGARDIDWNGHTWEALGGNLDIAPAGETPDSRAQTAELTLDGVDQTIIALILGQNYRGRLAKVYYARIDRGSNLCLRSEELDDASWTRLDLAAVTANAGADRRGRQVLDKLVENTNNAPHLLRRAVTITAGARLWAAVEIRAAERSRGAFYLDNAAFTSRMGVSFDLNAGTTLSLSSGSGVLDASLAEPLGAGLYRVWVRGQVDAASTSILPTLRLGDNSGNLTYLGDGSSGFYAGKVQVAMATAEVPYARAVDVARADGQITQTPLLVFSGYMNEPFEVEEERSPEGNNTVVIRTRLVSRLAGLTKIRGILTNLDSHQTFYSGDTFFQTVPTIAGRKIIWGRSLTWGEKIAGAKASRRHRGTQ